MGNWYTNVVDPKGVNLNKIGYQRGSCQQAEDIASKIVNLPTYPRMNSNDAYKVVNLLYDFHKRNK